MKHNYLFFFLLFLTTTGFAQTLEDDRLALLAFYNATNGSGWTNKSGWTLSGNAGDNPCGWFGVTCENGRVTALNLADNRFQGTIPAQIGNLTALKSLNLTGGSNGIYTETFLNGPLPTELGNLVNLEYLDLGKNHFTGEIPKSLGDLSQLKRLDLSFIPFDAGFDHFGQLTGSIPTEFGKLFKLEYLDLSLQNLNGDIPAQLGNLTALKTLNLRSNIFTGSIPSTFTKLTNLVLLDLSFDNFPTRGKEHGSLGGYIPSLLGIPISAYVDISGNSFNFSSLETSVSRIDEYKNQAEFQLIPTSILRTVSGISTYLLGDGAGGDYGGYYNTYTWYHDDVATGTGGSMIFAGPLGKYRLQVTNRLVPGLTLYSDTYVVTEVAAPSPVTLTAFAAKRQSSGNFLTWQTTSETTNKGFEIERSKDAINFENIGFIDGNGDSQATNDYGFLDKNPFTLTYYRLKQIDYDGKFEYSRIIYLKRDSAALSVYPNPAKEQLFVSGLESEENVTMHTLEGRLILDQKLQPSQPINTSNFSNGLYIIKVGEETRKVIIQN